MGQLAELSGVTVRTLRHYDQTGLLRPSGRTSGGHRLYDQQNVTRLYRVLALRRLGFSLAEVGSLLDDPDWDFQAMLTRHALQTTRTIASATRLAAHLRGILDELDSSQSVETDRLFTIMEEMTMLETPIRDTTTLLVYDDLAAAHTYLKETFGLGLAPSNSIRRDELCTVSCLPATTPSGSTPPETAIGRRHDWVRPAASSRSRSTMLMPTTPARSNTMPKSSNLW